LCSVDTPGVVFRPIHVLPVSNLALDDQGPGCKYAVGPNFVGANYAVSLTRRFSALPRACLGFNSYLRSHGLNPGWRLAVNKRWTFVELGGQMRKEPRFYLQLHLISCTTQQHPKRTPDSEVPVMAPVAGLPSSWECCQHVIPGHHMLQPVSFISTVKGLKGGRWVYSFRLLLNLICSIMLTA
jgi:hypothetical protein